MSYTKENGKLKFTVSPKAPVDTTVLEQRRAEFEAACVEFRAVCKQIGDFIENPNFKGGFDEIAEFKKHEKANTLEGLVLAMNWSSANDACTYLASKLGIGQPDWWYDCWMLVDEPTTIEEELEE